MADGQARAVSVIKIDLDIGLHHTKLDCFTLRPEDLDQCVPPHSVIGSFRVSNIVVQGCRSSQANGQEQ